MLEKSIMEYAGAGLGKCCVSVSFLKRGNTFAANKSSGVLTNGRGTDCQRQRDSQKCSGTSTVATVLPSTDMSTVYASKLVGSERNGSPHSKTTSNLSLVTSGRKNTVNGMLRSRTTMLR